MSTEVSELFDPSEWAAAPAGASFTDITYHHSIDGRIARVAFDRPEVRNAFRPHTVDELFHALEDARTNSRIGVVLLTGNGPSAKDGGWAFCSGGDQRIRGRDGYKYEPDQRAGETRSAVSKPGERGGFESSPSSPPRPAAASLGRLHILEVQRLIRFMPKVVIAVVPGWAAGGGHSLHVVCDLTIASREHGRFKQTDADVGSFDAGYGSAYFARQIGQKFAREVFFLAEEYSADRAYEMGAVNRVVPHAELEREAIAMARTVLTKSPTAIRMLKFAFNAVDDGMVGQQVFAGEATRLAYGTDEAVEGRDAFLEKRDPDWGPYPWHY
ncbi:1,4-dihydroxy-2-naphthoyl-CoA synthase [Agromyces italicus]|uniref:1,4-dihydroxy-2-naphthoyl-CoA synthase n=1 Tax=Agromyces italicus TaxID=279572 RepID=UPI0003B7ACC1|nr:1,4-dihydroxy-2-naphthoyl-CoA synthase [Agromyces italicus]